jgi:hypothetical protein
MNKITAAALCLILMLNVSLNAQTYGLKLIGKAKLPEGFTESMVNLRGVDIGGIDSTGKFVTDPMLYSGVPFGPDYGLVMDGQGRGLFYPFRYQSRITITNFIQNITEGGILKKVSDEITSEIRGETDPEVLFKTFSASGYTYLQKESGKKIKTRVKQTLTTREEILSESEDIQRLCISDFDSSGKIIRTQTFNGKYTPISKEFISAQTNSYKHSVVMSVSEGYINVYFITSPNSPAFINASNLSIKSINGNNLLATVETQSTNKINIQSSENAADWKTIQTISNPSGKQITIPANKAVEFIRAIE